LPTGRARISEPDKRRNVSPARIDGDGLCLDSQPCVEVWMAGDCIELRHGEGTLPVVRDLLADGTSPDLGAGQAPERLAGERRAFHDDDGDGLCLDSQPCVEVWMAGDCIELRHGEGTLPEEGRPSARRP
jgi:hypothetical protein